MLFTQEEVRILIVIEADIILPALFAMAGFALGAEHSLERLGVVLIVELEAIGRRFYQIVLEV